jgi:hypothetical protein
MRTDCPRGGESAVNRWTVYRFYSTFTVADNQTNSERVADVSFRTSHRRTVLACKRRICTAFEHTACRPVARGAPAASTVAELVVGGLHQTSDHRAC